MNKTSAGRAVEYVAETYHDDKAELGGNGCVEGGTRGMSVKNVLSEFEPFAMESSYHVIGTGGARSMHPSAMHMSLPP